MARSVGTVYLVLAIVVAGLSVAASLALRDLSYLVVGVGAGMSGIVVSAVLSGLADIVDELRHLREDVRGQQGTMQREPSQASAPRVREAPPLWAAANKSTNARPLFKDDGGKPEPEPYSPARSAPKIF